MANKKFRKQKQPRIGDFVQARIPHDENFILYDIANKHEYLQLTKSNKEEIIEQLFDKYGLGIIVDIVKDANAKLCKVYWFKTQTITTWVCYALIKSFRKKKN